MRIIPEITSTQVVLLGEFDPSTFTLDWLSQHKLIGESESRSSSSRAIGALADLSTEWCRIICTPEKFVLMSQQAPWVRMSDFLLKLFVECLPETRLAFMGINRTIQFETGSMSARDRLGRDLAPRSVWGEWGDILEGDEGKGESGLSTLTMKQGHALTDRSSGYIETRIGPGPASSIVITVNDHYEAPGGESAVSGELMRILSINFEPSIKRSDWIVDQIMKRVKA